MNQKYLPDKSKLAVIGGGIAGLSAAWLLSKQHQITLYEKNNILGGHSHTIDIAEASSSVPIDTGFIVYNEKNYPNLTKLFQHLGVQTEKTDMSFAYSLNGGELEYSGAGIRGLFSPRRNLLKAPLWLLLRDVFRFYREAEKLNFQSTLDVTVQDFLKQQGYSLYFAEYHLIPMIAAIWSAPRSQALNLPLFTLLNFFSNHGLLQIRNRPTWRIVSNGSRNYVSRLSNKIGGSIKLGHPIQHIIRSSNGVTLRSKNGMVSHYDGVIMATHANQALSLLAMPTDKEKRILSTFSYSKNRVVVHSDWKLMPRHHNVWSSWNVLGSKNLDAPLSVTYWMNRLQNLISSKDYFVSLNPPFEPGINMMHGVFEYEHPILTPSAIHTQRELKQIQGVGGVWFCGSYFGYGFHEDALSSGIAVASALGGLCPWHRENHIRETDDNCETVVLEVTHA